MTLHTKLYYLIIFSISIIKNRNYIAYNLFLKFWNFAIYVYVDIGI